MSFPHRRSGHAPRRARLALLVAIVAVFGVGGLYYIRSNRPAPARAGKSLPSTSQILSYTVRGRIEELPDPARPSSTLQLHHEEVKHFARKDGTLGMSAMTMSFPYSSAVIFDGLAVGDEVEFTLLVDWGGSPIYQITRIAKLPADTVLNFDAQAPSGR